METMTNNNNNNNNNKNNSNDDDDDDDSQPESNAKADLTVNPVEMILRLRKHASALKQKNGGKTNAEDNDDGIYTDEELHSFISMYVRGDIPDYQMSAWLMAVCFCPLTPRETATLTQCYAESGDLLEWPETLEGSSSSSSSSSSNGANSKGSSKGGSKRRPPLVDKHSSGGVGDKISLILAPLVATCGVAVPMIAGRGLGHTGGTIDKLETSFPGYKVEHSTEDFSAIVLGKGADSPGVGCAIVAAGPELCPADRKIYALRDVTATVSCLSLITASIMSKKIAERPDSLVLDVKHGEGAFMETVEDARLLAESLVAVGEANGLTPTTAFLTDMNHPIGRAVGNWLEVEECIDVMKGNLRHDRLRLGRDLIALVVVQAGQMLYQSCGSRTRTRTRSNSSGREDAGTTGADDEDENDDDDDDDDGASYRKYARMSLEECIRHAHEVLDSGKVLETFRRMLLAQGAEATHVHTALDTPGSIPLAKYLAAWVYREEEDAGTEATATATATAAITGNTPCTRIVDIPAKEVGDVAVVLGAGRFKASDDVDGQAGLVFGKQTGDAVVDGDVLVTVYTNRSQEVADAALHRVRRVVRFETSTTTTTTMTSPSGDQSSSRWKPSPIVTHRVTSEGGMEAFVMPDFLVDR